VDFLYQCLTDDSLTIVMKTGLTDAEVANAATVVTKIEAYVEGRPGQHPVLRRNQQGLMSWSLLGEHPKGCKCDSQVHDENPMLWLCI